MERSAMKHDFEAQKVSLVENSSGHIHWALGTALVDCHGIPTLSQRNDPPSKVGTSTLLVKDILEIILCTQQAEQKWIDTLSMLQRVHSIGTT